MQRTPVIDDVPDSAFKFERSVQLGLIRLYQDLHIERLPFGTFDLCAEVLLSSGNLLDRFDDLRIQRDLYTLWLFSNGVITTTQVLVCSRRCGHSFLRDLVLIGIPKPIKKEKLRYSRYSVIDPRAALLNRAKHVGQCRGKTSCIMTRKTIQH